jgi:hypothetical protein
MKLLCSEICGCQVGFKRSHDEAMKKELPNLLGWKLEIKLLAELKR